MADESPQYIALCNGLAHLQRALAALGQATEQLTVAEEPVFAGEARSFITPLGALANRLYERGLDRAAAEADADEDEEEDMGPLEWEGGPDDPMAQETDLGPCCACGTADPARMIRNVICLHVKAPEPGTGWGCMQCHLPADGACAVVCDACLQQKAEIREVIAGFATDKRRVPIASCTEAFTHNPAGHPELARLS